MTDQIDDREFVVSESGAFVGFFAEQSGADRMAEKTNGTVYGMDDIKKMTGPALVTLYNSVVEEDKQVKKFTNKEVAVDRVTKLLADRETVKVETTAKAQKKTAAKKKAVAGKTSILKTKTITRIPQPGRKWHEGSLRKKCYDCVEQGMTVQSYVDCCAKQGIGEAQALGALNKMASDPKCPTVKLHD